MKNVVLMLAGQAQLVATIPPEVENAQVVLLSMTAGNTRWGTNATELETPEAGQNRGLPTTVATSPVQIRWVGDLWAITDTPGQVVQAICPAAEDYQRRGMRVAKIPGGVRSQT